MRRLTSAAAIAALAAVSGCSTPAERTTAVEQAPAPAGTAVIRTNACTISNRDHVSLARLPDDAYATVWDSRKQQSGHNEIYARPFATEVTLPALERASETDMAMLEL